jgi:MFS transporter, AAHS family, 4-hydroxybenzoate transporter
VSSEAALSANGPTALDAKPFTAYQASAVFMASAMVILDGLDNQMLGIAAPSLIKEWGVAREQLGVIFALGFVGMFFGTLVAGWLGDRVGRRGALVFGVVIFGVATLLTGFSTDITHIAILRTLAGVGLGGVPGSAASLIAELTPARYRSIAVTAGVVCVAIGGILGGIVATMILPHFGWRWLFYLGGIVPLIAAALIAKLLPESPRFLASHPKHAPELNRILTRIGYSAQEIEAFRQAPEAKAAFVPTSALLKGGLRRDTLALCVAFFTGMFMIYLMYNWAPTLLFANDFAIATTSKGLTSFNIGGVIGAIVASVLVTWLGSRGVLPVLATVGAGLCVWLAMLPIKGALNEDKLLFGLLGLGLSASAVQSAMFAIAAYAFPAPVRARGMGLIGAAGRIGAIVSAFSGAFLTTGGSVGFFGVLAGLMLINAISLAIVRGHVPAHIAGVRKSKP